MEIATDYYYLTITYQYSRHEDMSSVKVAKATTTTYKAEDICGPKANIPSPLLFQDPGYFHTALLEVLEC